MGEFYSEGKEWFKSVLEGLGNIDNQHPVVLFVKAHRYKECKNCSKNTFNVCRMCGCPLKSKLGSYTTSCPLKKWGQIKVDVIKNNDSTIYNVIENNKIIYSYEERSDSKD